MMADVQGLNRFHEYLPVLNYCFFLKVGWYLICFLLETKNYADLKKAAEE